MKRYKIISHTADTGIIAYGRDLSEVYANAAFGMFAIMTDMRRIKAKEAITVEIKGTGELSLLFNWLNHLLYLFEVQHFIFRDFQITGLSSNSLKAECRGEKYDSDRHILKTGVKSATYHLMDINRVKNRATVIFDV